MKILIIIDSLGSGGAEHSTAVMADFLNVNKIDFNILCLDRKKVGVELEMKRKGYKISFLRKSGFYLQIREIAEVIKKGDFDVVHSILFRSNIRTRFAKFFTQFTHIESLVSTTYSKERFLDKNINSKALMFYRLIDKYTAKYWVDHFHSISETVKLHYKEQLGIPDQKITVIYRGRTPLKNQIRLNKKSSDCITLINVGRNEYAKGQIYFVKSLKNLKELGYNFRAQIYGREGNSTNAIKEFIFKNNLEDCVSLEGYTDQISEKLLIADIFIFPSLYEGLGGALIEAQAAGLPIVCSDIPVLHEVVIQNKNAKFFESRDIDSLVNAIRFYLDKPEKIKEFGEVSLQNFQNKFLESENNNKMLELYKHLC